MYITFIYIKNQGEVRRSLIRAAGNYVKVFGFLRNLLGVMLDGRTAEGIPI
jgi:hypothetical protein